MILARFTLPRKYTPKFPVPPCTTTSKLPKKHRRPCPNRPQDFDRVISGELRGSELKAALQDYNDQAFDDFNKKALLECKICKRTFLPKALEVHQRSCRPKPDAATSSSAAGNSNSSSSIKPTTKRYNPRPPRSNSPNKTSPSKSRIPTSSSNNATTSGNPAPPPAGIRPGTYKKSESNNNEFQDPPSRQDIVSLIEKDIAFSEPEVRTELMNFIKNLTQSKVVTGSW